MISTTSLVTGLALAVMTAACGDDGGAITVDAAAGPDAPTPLRVTGTAQTLQGTNLAGLAGATIEAFATAGGAALATSTSAVDGRFQLTLPTEGGAFDGYLKGTSPGRLPGYFYDGHPLVADAPNARVFIFEQQTVDLLGSLVGTTQEPTKAFLVVAVMSTVGTGVAGATVTVSPAGSARVYYNDGNGTPSATATATDPMGIAYVVNAEVGTVTVDAAMGATAFDEHAITTRIGAVTVALVEP